jgi:hypothetical protein
VNGDRLALRLVLPADVRPDVTLMIESSPDLSHDNWREVARKSGTAAWSGTATVVETQLGDQRTEVIAELPAPISGEFRHFLQLRVSLR